jgi:hypothetical protein
MRAFLFRFADVLHSLIMLLYLINNFKEKIHAAV